MIIKVCGMRDADNIREVMKLGIDWIGFIFYPQSPRYVSMVPTHAGIIPDKGNVQIEHYSDAPQGTKDLSTSNVHCKRVGVFVDDMPQNIITRVVNYQLDIVQLHGHETTTMIRNLRRTLDPDIRPNVKFMKAISVKCRDDVMAYKDYEDCVDFFLFDTRCHEVGGSGEQFDWSILEAYDGNKPFLLSGGIGPNDAPRVKQFHHPLCVGIDLNSRFEIEPAIKDIHKLQLFLNQL